MGDAVYWVQWLWVYWLLMPVADWFGQRHGPRDVQLLLTLAYLAEPDDWYARHLWLERQWPRLTVAVILWMPATYRYARKFGAVCLALQATRGTARA